MSLRFRLPFVTSLSVPLSLSLHIYLAAPAGPDCRPLVVFINRKSGGQQGAALLASFQVPLSLFLTATLLSRYLLSLSLPLHSLISLLSLSLSLCAALSTGYVISLSLSYHRAIAIFYCVCTSY